MGDKGKLFLTGTGLDDTNNPDFYLPCMNPNVDLIDAHHGLYGEEHELSHSFDVDKQYRDTYSSTVNNITSKRPFHNGEYNYYAFKDLDGDTATHHDDVETGGYFDNYDISFHNEIWASAFFGNFAAGTTWNWPRVFWWPDALPQMYGDNHIPYDDNNGWQQRHSGVLGAFNILQLSSSLSDTVRVQNRTTYHNFKPLSEMLSNPNWQAYGFFNGDFSPHKVYNDTTKIECYYLVNADSTLAIGWVHNLNAYWENHYYVQRELQNFLGCTAPSSPQQVEIHGLAEGPDYHITWFPTRMNDTIHPVDTVDTTGTGTVLLDMSTAPLGDTANRYLDTLHLDYGFIISMAPVLRSMEIPVKVDTVASSSWDFGLYPNPAQEKLNVVLPDNSIKEITIYDLSGRKVYQSPQAVGPLVIIPTGRLSRGTYCIRVSDSKVARNKLLIIQ